MKTIFLFDDSRIIDFQTLIVAIGEDGQLVTAVKFDEATAPHAQFAMGYTHALGDAEHQSVAIPLHETRAATLSRYDAVYGAGGWIPVWLDVPADNAAFVAAVRIYRQALREKMLAKVEATGSLLASLLGTIFQPLEHEQRSLH